MSNPSALRDDFSRGLLRSDDGLIVVKPGSRLEDLEPHSPLQQQAPTTGERQVHRLSDVQLGGRRCSLQVMTRNGLVAHVFVMAKDPVTPMWDFYKEKQKHEEWLRSIFGHAGPYQFDWGHILVEVDIKTGWAPIVFVYDRRPNRKAV
jgi:hypothetical protein